MNGYFELIGGEKGAIKFYPPTDGGDAIDIKELEYYLKKHGIDYNLKDINEAIEKKEEKTVPLICPVSYTIDEDVSFRISDDAMEAYARFYPPTRDGKGIDEEALTREIRLEKLRYGIDMSALDKFRADKKYCTDYLIAKGVAPVQGIDGVIEYFFNTDTSAKPTVNEDGTVDFYHLNTVVSCKKGDKLAKIRPGKDGTAGVDVYGTKYLPKKVNKPRLSFGKDVEISEDGMELTAGRDGHVKLLQGKVCVFTVLEMQDIGPATGNIENFQGNLLIKGNVMAGFKVSATGDIEVKGVIESADVEAGGQIIVAKGINGSGHATIKAGTNIIAKYVENAKLIAEGYIHADCLMNCEASAGDSITVTGKKGLIAGGTIRATKYIETKKLGSAMGVFTEAQVGTDPKLKLRHEELIQRRMDLQKDIERIKPILVATKQKILNKEKITDELRQATQAYSQKFVASEKELGEIQKELEAIETKMKDNSHGYVSVSELAYAGTRIMVAADVLVLKNNYKYCRFMKKDGEVKMVPFV